VNSLKLEDTASASSCSPGNQAITDSTRTEEPFAQNVFEPSTVHVLNDFKNQDDLDQNELDPSAVLRAPILPSLPPSHRGSPDLFVIFDGLFEDSDNEVLRKPHEPGSSQDYSFANKGERYFVIHDDLTTGHESIERSEITQADTINIPATPCSVTASRSNPPCKRRPNSSSTSSSSSSSAFEGNKRPRSDNRCINSGDSSVSVSANKNNNNKNSFFAQNIHFSGPLK
jgi:hypothetical protein